MSTQEEANKSKGFEFCQSFMNKCCNPGAAEEKGEKADFKSCEQMMKQFCGTKDGKFDFEACMSKMAQCCKGMNEKSSEKVNG
ncbi:MAG: hypothetical protein LLG40_08945 [Deltaproteobacteria bacterium]|nr:hypothetical protein [Deltaproteobacteria bacterium]